MGITLSPWMMAFLVLMTGFAGFVDSAAGGGGLISLPAYLFAGLPPPSYRPMPKPMPSASRIFFSFRVPSSRFLSGRSRCHKMTTAATGRMRNIMVRSSSSLSSSTICAPSALPAKLPMAARMPTFSASLFTYLMNGLVVFHIGIPCAVSNILGNLLGSHFALKKGARFIRPMMLVVLVLLLGKLISDAVL